MSAGWMDSWLAKLKVGKANNVTTPNKQSTKLLDSQGEEEPHSSEHEPR